MFEGEGCCRVGTTGNRQPRVSLVMTDQDVVEKFRRIVRHGNVRAYTYTGKPTWQWTVQSRDDVLYVLDLLWEHLGERRKEAATEVIERAVKMNDGQGFCKHGHDLSIPANVYRPSPTGKRYCQPCITRRSHERRGSS